MNCKLNAFNFNKALHHCLNLNGSCLPGLNVKLCRTYAFASASKRSATHYYDVLGISPRATQSQIKTAYYKMSKLYHPDVSASEKGNNHAMFTDISEAYEVLGNLQKRRMYDRGLGIYNKGEKKSSYGYSPQQSASRHEAKPSPFERGDRPPPPRGQTSKYNFDEFYRQHYNDVRERRGREFEEFKKYQNQMDNLEKHPQHDQLALSVGAMLVILIAFICLTDSYDYSYKPKGSGSRP